MAKREPNAERRAKEDERRITRHVAEVLGPIIRNKGRLPSEWSMSTGWTEFIDVIKLSKGRLTFLVGPKPRSRNTIRIKLVHPPVSMTDAFQFFKGQVYYKRDRETDALRETYALIGREFCEFKGNVSEFLRLVAAKIQGKREYSPGDDWNDAKINAAHAAALMRKLPVPLPLNFSSNDTQWPTFSEFWEVFLEQNPKSKLLKDHADSEERNSLRRQGYNCYTKRSLQRSLRRLACALSLGKRGRPTEK
jgi:hypothetical protein